ncbi:DNA translocase FtsK [Paraliobacillus salinarum]|uniref:DNA translocase FtsK n=1 Tax=Paraliobacillus salinarum TaxID=1158996 RepID=UPI0015F74DCC|nr:DNA translocase FtsK [Paraliobacillus salinarum]
MLHRWKDKMKEWFHASDEESSDDFLSSNNEQNHLQTQNVETKVYYQYPSNKRFNFPAIPDEPKKHTMQKETRRNRSEIKKNQDSTHSNEQTEEKKKNKPFSPTPVPSPVYGFGKRPNDRSKQEIDTPAFLRKEELNKQKEELLNESEQINTGNKLLTPKEERHSQSAQQHTEEEIKDYQADSLQNTQSMENNDNNHNNDSQLTQQEERILVQTEEKTTVAPTQQQVETQEVRKKRQPFNVRMRPSDKKRFYEKREITNQENKNDQKRPPIHLLNDPTVQQDNSNVWIEQQADLLENTLKQFHVNAKVIASMQGPTVTRFEVQPEAGVKVSKIKNLSDDIKLNMAAKDIRMEAPIPGKHAIGIEIPNQQAKAVTLQEIFKTKQFQQEKSPLNIALGLDIAGSPIVTDIKKMPHGLIAGATGSGKSVCINTILISLLYRASHEDVKLMLIDPKMVELAPYNDVPHLVAPVITNIKAATHALKWAVAEMEERYEKFVQESTRDIERYNQKMLEQQRLDEKMPYMVIVIDELADLMMVAPQDVEDAICRIAQKARACGIHLLLATQRPSVDVITGLIKANIPTRIAFSVSSQVDSRTIIDTNGAERLLGRGDMLFVENGARHPVRVQGAFVTDEEIERVTSFAKKQAPTNYLFQQEDLLDQVKTEETEDELYPEVLSFVIEQNGASASLLQRRFKIGYNRAARLIDALEYNGIISAQKGSKPRDVLVSTAEID